MVIRRSRKALLISPVMVEAKHLSIWDDVSIDGRLLNGGSQGHNQDVRLVPTCIARSSVPIAHT